MVSGRWAQIPTEVSGRRFEKDSSLKVKNILRGGAVAARWAHNPKVGGSNPSPATKESRMIAAFFIMYYVYIIQSITSGNFYIGSSGAPEGRLIAHNHPQNKGWTKRHQPWELVYTEVFETKSEALIHEKKIKSLKSRDAINRIITDAG